MPRLSVDIDLTYLPIDERAVTFRNMHSILQNISKDLARYLGYKVASSYPLNGNREAKLLVSNGEVEIKIEPNYTIRGSVFPVLDHRISSKCLEVFGHAVTARCLSRGDLYGGKICAALDRQHPRDLFDMKIFFETGGFDRTVIDGFLFYLISHNRPFHEVIAPNPKNLESEFSSESSGMTEEDVNLHGLVSVRERLIKDLRDHLSPRDKEFLIGIASGTIDWGKYAYPQIQTYPSIRWRIANLDTMQKNKRAIQVKALEEALG
jgi:hypothetical protein